MLEHSMMILSLIQVSAQLSKNWFDGNKTSVIKISHIFENTSNKNFVEQDTRI